MQTRLSIQKRVGLNILKSGSNMGYYTDYTLTMVGEEQAVKHAENDLIEVSNYPDGSPDSEIKDLVNYGYVNAKLYEIQDYMKKVAEKNPDVLIILNGDGEESDDLWEERWKGSEHELQNATIPPFENPNLWTDTEKEKQNNN